MTEENYKYRTSQIMLRNQFPGNGVWNIPIIPKFQERSGDFDDLLLIGFDKTGADDRKHANRMVHFFLYDYRFERVWEKPDSVLDRLHPYRAVHTTVAISACRVRSNVHLRTVIGWIPRLEMTDARSQNGTIQTIAGHTPGIQTRTTTLSHGTVQQSIHTPVLQSIIRMEHRNSSNGGRFTI